MPVRNLRVFLDTSVIIAAVLSPDGRGRMLFRLAETGVLQIVLGPSVIQETDEVVRCKVPDSLPDLANLLSTARVEQGPGARPKDLEMALQLLNYPPDGRVLAEALRAQPDWFVTHDKEHFLQAKLKKRLPFHLGTPGDLIQYIRNESISGVMGE